MNGNGRRWIVVSRSFLLFYISLSRKIILIKSGLRLCEGTTKEERLPYETSVYVPPSPSLHPFSRSHPIRTPSRSLVGRSGGWWRACAAALSFSLALTHPRGRIGNEASFHLAPSYSGRLSPRATFRPHRCFRTRGNERFAPPLFFHSAILVDVRGRLRTLSG